MAILNIQKPKEYTKITSLALGHFDGMHIAHQGLFAHLDENGAILAVGIENSILTPFKFRKYFSDKKIFGLYLSDIQHLTSGDFINKLSNIFPNLQKLIIGYDFKMGKNRSCDVKCISDNFAHLEVKIVDEIKLDGVSVHSSIIKSALNNGDILRVNELIGRKYCIFGDTISGQGIGSKDFVSTINIKNNYNFMLPSFGVYATKTLINNKKESSVTFIGKRKSTDNAFSIETHIIDKKIKIKNKTLQVFFVKKIRDNIYFKNKTSLKNQIDLDIKTAKELNCKFFINNI